MKKILISLSIIAVVAAVAIGAIALVSSATFQEVIIWDPNGNLGRFTDATPNFSTILDQLDNPATINVSGGSTALKTAVATAPSGSVIEITDSATYDGGLVITDKTDIVIRAALGASPVIECSILGLGGTCLNLNATADGSVKNIGIKGLTFKNIRFSHWGSAMTGQGIASFSGHILENIVIEDNTFDNSDPTKDQSYKGSAIHLNKVDGLLIRRNTIINGALHTSTSTQRDAAITLHEFLVQPDYLNNVFIQNNHIWFDYAAINLPYSVIGNTRGIVLSHLVEQPSDLFPQRFNNVVVEYNLIDNVQKEGIKIFGVSSDTTDDETVTVRNTVIKRTDDGIEMDGGTLFVDRTIFDGLTSFGKEGKDEGIDSDGGVTTVSNSIVINKNKGVTGSGVTIFCIDLFNPVLPHPTSSAGGTIFNIDPMFVNTSINDYRIGNPSFPAGCVGGDFGLEFVPTNQPPVAVCKDVSVPADSGCTASASIDNGSYDPDGDPITVTQSPAGPYPLGDTLATLTVTDSKGATDQCTATVTVVDQTPPTISDISINPSVLWPANHKMVPVTVTVSVFDNCGPPMCSIVSVTSNEPINGLGDGDTAPDWQINGGLTVNLRAERSGKGSGRIYTITIECKDASGNTTTGTVAVNVPHDQGKK